mgnify:CR=1 FL=1
MINMAAIQNKIDEAIIHFQEALRMAPDSVETQNNLNFALEKKKNDVQAELEGSPRTHVDARSSILANIALSREFADTFLQFQLRMETLICLV